MISVLQTDLSIFSSLATEGGQVLQTQQLGETGESDYNKIRDAVQKALNSAEEMGLETLLIPVINSRNQGVDVAFVARIMVSEVRRHLSLGSKIKEITFALGSEAGARSFEEVIHRNAIWCLGDSITYGYPDGPNYSWVQRVAEVTGYYLENLGVSGETTGQMLNRLRSFGDFSLPAYLIFLGGHNDGWQGVALEEVKENVNQVVELAQERGICPILGLPSPLNIGQLLENFEGTLEEAENYEKSLNKIREWIIEFAAAKNLLTLDFYNPLKQGGIASGDPELLLDGGHPNHLGYRKLGDAVIEQLEGRLYF